MSREFSTRISGRELMSASQCGLAMYLEIEIICQCIRIILASDEKDEGDRVGKLADKQNF